MVLGAAAFPLAPFLYRHHYLILVLLRPTRLVLFFGGVQWRRHATNPWFIVIAALPLGLFGVWQAYALGLTYKTRISSGHIPPRWKRFFPTRRIRRLQEVLREQGIKLVILARIGTFPSYLIGTAAGSSDVDPKKFFIADGTGVILEIGASMSLGYLVGKGGGQAVVIGIGVAAVAVAGLIYGLKLHRR
jgi:membrane protein DedA with SNARE-associated domain